MQTPAILRAEAGSFTAVALSWPTVSVTGRLQTEEHTDALGLSRASLIGTLGKEEGAHSSGQIMLDHKTSLNQCKMTGTTLGVFWAEMG